MTGTPSVVGEEEASRRARWSAVVAMTTVLLAACGGESGVFDSSSVASSVTSGATTTVATTTTVAATSTAAPTTSEQATSTSTAAVPVVMGVPSESSIDTPPIQVTISMPVMSGLTDATIQDRINKAIADELEARRTRFVADATGAYDPANPGPGPFTLEIAFETTAVTDKLLSLRFTGSEYYQGASELAVIFTMNFDLRTGFLLDLADVLLAGGPVALAALAEQHLIADLYGGDPAALYGWVPGITPAMLTRWVVSGTGFEISFGQYDVGPGAMGAPTVVIPYSELGGIVDPAGPAGP
jgi:hypothetical protein